MAQIPFTSHDLSLKERVSLIKCGVRLFNHGLGVCHLSSCKVRLVDWVWICLPNPHQPSFDAGLCARRIERYRTIEVKCGHAVQDRPQFVEQRRGPGLRTTSRS